MGPRASCRPVVATESILWRAIEASSWHPHPQLTGPCQDGRSEYKSNFLFIGVYLGQTFYPARPLVLHIAVLEDLTSPLDRT